MKQMSWLSGLSATASPRRAASSRICGLGVSPIGNSRVAQLLGGQHRQHVGLVLVVVDGATQPPIRQPCVVTGGHRVEAQCQRAGGQRGELDPLVAAHARVGCLAAGVGVDTKSSITSSLNRSAKSQT